MSNIRPMSYVYIAHVSFSRYYHGDKGRDFCRRPYTPYLQYVCFSENYISRRMYSLTLNIPLLVSYVAPETPSMGLLQL